eukprot:5506115-Lingulodinium_polyedra.AAC.1
MLHGQLGVPAHQHCARGPVATAAAVALLQRCECVAGLVGRSLGIAQLQEVVGEVEVLLLLVERREVHPAGGGPDCEG